MLIDVANTKKKLKKKYFSKCFISLQSHVGLKSKKRESCQFSAHSRLHLLIMSPMKHDTHHSLGKVNISTEAKNKHGQSSLYVVVLYVISCIQVCDWEIAFFLEPVLLCTVILGLFICEFVRYVSLFLESLSLAYNEGNLHSQAWSVEHHSPAYNDYVSFWGP